MKWKQHNCSLLLRHVVMWWLTGWNIVLRPELSRTVILLEQTLQEKCTLLWDSVHKTTVQENSRSQRTTATNFGDPCEAQKGLTATTACKAVVGDIPELRRLH
eukprot:1040338-Amphidinium_carterae.1